MIATIKNIINFKKTSRKTKIITLLYLGFIALYINSFAIQEWRGDIIPPATQLKHNAGIFDYSDSRNRNGGSVDIWVREIGWTNNKRPYSCNYSAHNGALKPCLPAKEILQYVGKTVDIGWYSYKSDTAVRQLVTMDVDGKPIITRQDTLDHIKTANTRLIWITLVMVIFMTCLFDMVVFVWAL